MNKEIFIVRKKGVFTNWQSLLIISKLKTFDLKISDFGIAQNPKEISIMTNRDLGAREKKILIIKKSTGVAGRPRLPIADEVSLS